MSKHCGPPGEPCQDERFCSSGVTAEKLCKTAMKGSGEFINPTVNLRFTNPSSSRQAFCVWKAQFGGFRRHRTHPVTSSNIAPDLRPLPRFGRGCSAAERAALHLRVSGDR